MMSSAGAERALQALNKGLATPELFEALSGLVPGDRTELLENQLLHSVASDDRGIRNASALALADLRSTIAPHVIRDMLLSPRTAGSRATLLYALRQMRGRLTPQLIAFLITEDEEVGEEVLSFLEEGLLEPVPRPEIERLTAHLRCGAERDEFRSKQDIMLDAADLLEEMRER